ncbi:MAG TPA: TetR/AcrR family transcriptional regulator C-terminal domain-containing protein [Thermomicrobiales bacterium]|nr:TetR/AcrR family transcriptional regulator C-terminal domain-containing protein [Thermomicrobiales bacterium]
MPPERETLNRDRILQAAMAIADDEGLPALTMRLLGQRLGVEAMSLYNHVANKDDILTGILDLAMREIALPPADAPWNDAIRASALSAHRTLLRHPWACRLMMERDRGCTARLHWMEEILGTLRRNGFSPEMTHHAYHALDSHITGFTLWLVNLPARGDELLEMAASARQRIPIEVFPWTIEHIDYHISPPPAAEYTGSEFEFGLDLLLEGLERRRTGS